MWDWSTLEKTTNCLSLIGTNLNNLILFVFKSSGKQNLENIFQKSDISMFHFNYPESSNKADH